MPLDLSNVLLATTGGPVDGVLDGALPDSKVDNLRSASAHPCLAWVLSLRISRSLVGF